MEHLPVLRRRLIQVALLRVELRGERSALVWATRGQAQALLEAVDHRSGSRLWRLQHLEALMRTALRLNSPDLFRGTMERLPDVLGTGGIRFGVEDVVKQLCRLGAARGW